MVYREIGFYIFVFYLGALLGSLYDLVGYRLIAKKSLLAKSKCDSCGKDIKYIYLLPIIGYILCLGRCQNCKKRISVLHPLTEVLTGCLFILNLYLYRIGFISGSIYYIGFILISYLIILTISDIYYQELPDSITLIFFLCAIFSSMPLQDKLLGFLVGFVVLYLIAYVGYKATKVQAIGGGDIKLFGAIGVVLGPLNVLITLFLASLFGLIGSKLIKKKDNYIPFVPFIMIAAIIMFYFGDFIVDKYMMLVRGKF